MKGQIGPSVGGSTVVRMGIDGSQLERLNKVSTAELRTGLNRESVLLYSNREPATTSRI